jgi:UDP:flavonoid glycosyltransferase YjiC (YdhE family)
MKITFATFGTRGDTEPFRIIADVLVDRGHEVLILTDEQNIEDFSCTKANVEGVVDSKETKNEAFRAIQNLSPQHSSDKIEELWIGPTINKFNSKLIVPSCDVLVVHQFLRRWTAKNANQAMRKYIFMNSPLSNVSIQEFQSIGTETLVGISPYMFPYRDLPQNISLIGFILPKQSTSAKQVKREAFSDPQLPTYLYCGGTCENNLNNVLANIETLANFPINWAIQTKNSAKDLPNVKFVKSTDHMNLIPNADLVIHNGGIGTMAKIVSLGIPNICAPQFGDQEGNAKCLFMHGVSPGTWCIDEPIDAFYRIIGKSLEQLAQLNKNANDLRCDLASESGLNEFIDTIERKI